MNGQDDPNNDDLNRREVIVGLLAVGGAMMAPKSPAQNASRRVNEGPVDTAIQTADIVLKINGNQHRLPALAVNTTLLDCLRDNLHLTGTKKGCALGQCGACTVLVDGRRVNACLSLAIMQQNRPITTIEGLAAGDTLHPLQTAFIEHDAFQCGYCTSGQIISGVACIQEQHTGTDDEIREWMSGNLCRCGAYPNIVAAVRQVAGRSA